MRKPLMAIAIVALLVLSVVGGLIPILQGWIFFVIALYLLATEFETGRRWVKHARRRWPWLNRWIVRARDHRWAPSHLKEFEDLTDPWAPDSPDRREQTDGAGARRPTGQDPKPR